MPDQDLVVTSAKQWRKLREEGQLVKLPSGFVCRLRPVSLEELVKAGRVPDKLTAAVSEAVIGNLTGNQVGNIEKRAEDAVDLMQLICRAAMMEPKLSKDPDDPGEDEISFWDLTILDREYIYFWVQAPQQAVQGFRDEQVTGVSALPDS